MVATGVAMWTPDRPLADLETRYLESSGDYREVDGLRLHVRVSGSVTAPAVVLLHGFGSSLHTWEPWASALATDYRVIRFDLPGFGLTGAEPCADYSDKRAMALINALLDQLGIARASFVGNSLGGRIAWRYAAEFPARVGKLVLIAPDGFASPGFDYEQHPTVPLLVKLMPYVLPKFLLRMNLQPAYVDPAALDDALFARYYDLLLAPGVRTAMLDRLAQVFLPHPEPLLARITAPTLLLWGERDALIPISNAADYLRALPQATLVRLRDLGHVPQEEAPERALVPLQEFLSEGPASSGAVLTR